MSSSSEFFQTPTLIHPLVSHLSAPSPQRVMNLLILLLATSYPTFSSLVICKGYSFFLLFRLFSFICSLVIFLVLTLFFFLGHLIGLHLINEFSIASFFFFPSAIPNLIIKPNKSASTEQTEY